MRVLPNERALPGASVGTPLPDSKTDLPPVIRRAEVVAFDPIVHMPTDRLKGVAMTASAEEAVEGADAAVLVTEWPAIVGLDWAAVAPTMRTPVLIDGRNALDPLEMTALGYVFEGIGRIPAHVGVEA